MSEPQPAEAVRAGDRACGPGDVNDLGQQVDANLTQTEANAGLIDGNLKMVKSARWRLLRNRRLIDRSWELLRANDRLIAQNNLLIMRRQQQINALLR